MTAGLPTTLKLNEADWQKWVIDLANQFGWTLRYHTYRSNRSAAGFPDWVLLNERAGASVFVELKGWDTPVSAKQLVWLNGMRRCNLRAHLWRPRHAEETVAVLANPFRAWPSPLPKLFPEDVAVKAPKLAAGVDARS